MQRREPRIIIGIALMVAATVAGALFLQRASQRTAVWQLDRALTAGTVLTAADANLTEVAIDAVASVYLTAGTAIEGRVLAHAVGAGELLSRHAVAAAPDDSVEVTVPAEQLHMPVSLRHGQRVDVWATSTGEPPLRTHRVLAQVRVVAVAPSEMRAGTAVVLAVPEDDVKPLVRALREGDLDLVRVPS